MAIGTTWENALVIARSSAGRLAKTAWIINDPESCEGPLTDAQGRSSTFQVFTMSHFYLLDEYNITDDQIAGVVLPDGMLLTPAQIESTDFVR